MSKIVERVVDDILFSLTVFMHLRFSPIDLTFTHLGENRVNTVLTKIMFRSERLKKGNAIEVKATDSTIEYKDNSFMFEEHW